MTQIKEVIFLVVCCYLFVGSNACELGYYANQNGQCKSCPSNCQVCTMQDSNLACYSCQEGFRVDIDTMKCVRCIQNCKQCSRRDGRCETCIENYLYNHNTNRCQEQRRDGNGVVICIDGYFNRNGLCLQCPAFCNKCDDYGTCQECEDKFYVGVYEAYYVSQVQCMTCQLPCKTCTSASECIEKYDTKDYYEDVSGRGKCEKGQFESQGDGKCYTCGKGCIDCNKYGVCLQCDSPYYLQDDKVDFPLPYCQPCDAGTQCAEKASRDSQENCGTGYFQSLYTDECIPCGFACQHCTQTGKCFSCSDGYVVNSQYYCVTEKEKQQEDNPCPTGKYSDPVTSMCTQCKQNCIKCHGWNYCDQCQTGFHLAGADNKCYNQTEYHQDQNQVNCYMHYYRDGNKCVECDSTCDVCNKNQCLACKKGYTLNYSTWKCESHSTPDTFTCTDGCEVCSTFLTCSKCKDGYYAWGPKCYPCPAGCPHCLSAEICSSSKTCSPGQYLSSSNTCKSCSVNCRYCKSAVECQECNSGYTLKNNFCEQQEDQPLHCPSGQYANSYGSCSNCSKGCQLCSSSSQCFQCFSGYSMTSGYSCQENSCPDGTFKNSKGGCQSCGPQCTYCRDGDTCDNCIETYYPTESGYCWKCNAFCRTCQKGGDCTDYTYNPNGDRCPTGQFLNSYDNCYKCPTGCNKCPHAYACKQCAAGYHLSDDLCKPCPSGCSQCPNGVCTESQDQIDYSTAVSSCGLGKYQRMGMCWMCGPGCDYCDQDLVCYRCKNKFYLNGGMCANCAWGCNKCTSYSNCLSYTDTEFESQGISTMGIIAIVAVICSLLIAAYLAYKNCSNTSKPETLLAETKTSSIEIQGLHAHQQEVHL